MTSIVFQNESGVLVRFDRHDETEEALDLLTREGHLYPSASFFYVKPKTLEDLAKIDIFAQAGYVGLRKRE